MPSQSRAPSSFEHRLDRLFGRSADVDALIQRTGQKGLTVVTGRPRMGKTWMIQEVCRRLDEGLDTLVGYFECPGGAVDVPLRAVADAYARWLRSSSFTEQGKRLLDDQDNLISRAGKVVGELIETVTGGKALGGLGIADLFAKLAAADENLKTGGLSLAPLPYDQVKELVDLLAKLTGQSVVLVLDQWEKSDGWEGEVDLVDSYLRHAADWPHGHIIGVVRTEPESEPMVGRLERVCREWPPAKIYPLETMERGEGEDARLTRHLRALLPASATEEVSDEQLLAWVGGNPGVLHQWREPASRYRIGTAKGLHEVAKEAQANRFPDLEAALERLRTGGASTRPQLNLAIRLALIPRFEGDEAWRDICAIVLDESMDDSTIADLQDLGILSTDSLAAPTYGHEIRREVAISWALDSAKALTRPQAMLLIRQAAERVRRLGLEVVLPAVIVIAVFRQTSSLSLPQSYKLAFHCCASLLSEQPSEEAVRDLSRLTVEDYKVGPPVLLALGLVNGLSAAKSVGNVSIRDEYLALLRSLSSLHSEDAAVREWLAVGLYNTLNDVLSEGDRGSCDALLEELRVLSEAHPEDAAVRKEFAMAVFNTLHTSLSEDDVLGRDKLLAELRTLSSLHPGDGAVRQQFAMGLVNTQAAVGFAGGLSGRDRLLAELRAVSRLHPEDAAVREQLAMGLNNALLDIDSEGDVAVRDGLLAELRTLSSSHSEDVAVREQLAKSLSNALHAALPNGDVAVRDGLLDELRALLSSHPKDKSLPMYLAMGLASMLNTVASEGDASSIDALLSELQTLYQEQSQDQGVAEQFARGLGITLKAIDDPDRSLGLLEENRRLQAVYPSSDLIKLMLAGGTVFTWQRLGQKIEPIEANLRVLGWTEEDLERAATELDEALSRSDQPGAG